ncbi:hypothetical protein [Phyllobacterium zundukense]|uniref:hypothetical protein n=1 Tax=Phyllobacterium zundukense TaxID=1867719 RepID=UPI001055CA71|nr:hypothetical protein [Phyllobacterium zundukense]
MGRDEPTMEELRVELSNLRDDLAVIESSAIFFKGSTGSHDAVNAIRRRIAELESILERNDE